MPLGSFPHRFLGIASSCIKPYLFLIHQLGHFAHLLTAHILIIFYLGLLPFSLHTVCWLTPHICDPVLIVHVIPSLLSSRNELYRHNILQRVGCYAKQSTNLCSNDFQITLAHQLRLHELRGLNMSRAHSISTDSANRAQHAPSRPVDPGLHCLHHRSCHH
jgi:hypothetical protein